MDGLKLVALDETDLGIVSAHVQDAVAKVGDLRLLPAARRFVLPINRFAWEKATGVVRQHNERRNSVLAFDRVNSVRASGIRRDRPEDVLSLLAVRFLPGEAPSGEIELAFSGDATLRLSVECIEVRLADLGGAWEAASRPAHRL
jgi:hypothetical protein